MNRRGFLGTVATIAALGAVVPPAHAEPRPDDFVERGVRFRWSGWREMPNQWLTVGFWCAWPESDQSGRFMYCTTMGHVNTANECETLDMRLHADWPVIRSSSDPDALRVKARARDRLMAAVFR